MATYFLRSSHISRGKGSLATRAAAYRSGERIKDERTGVTYDFSDRRDVAYKEVVLPSDLAGRADMAWSQDRAILWNAMEYAGTRHNSRVAREWLVLVPQELAPDQRVALVRTFAAELANKYRAAVDVAIHEPRPGADRRNHHAHLLMTTREVSLEGVGVRTRLELGGRERHQRGLGPSRDEYVGLRARWAEVTNDAVDSARVHDLPIAGATNGAAVAARYRRPGHFGWAVFSAAFLATTFPLSQTYIGGSVHSRYAPSRARGPSQCNSDFLWRRFRTPRHYLSYLTNWTRTRRLHTYGHSAIPAANPHLATKAAVMSVRTEIAELMLP